MLSKSFFKFFVPFLLIILIPSAAFSIRIEDEETGTDLLLMGLGVLRVNYVSIGGDRISFEESDRGLPEFLSNSSQADLLIEGTYRGYDLEGYLHYRDVTYNYEPHLDFFLKIKRDLNYLSIGDHVEGVFTDTLFTRFEPEFRGGLLHLESERSGFEIFGGAIRGEQGEEEIPADGTSGPYYISNYPIMDGSETVYIRVRDKGNESLILKTEIQRRGIDYKIDYDDGEIKFKLPVEETDFHGNPVYILVKYQYDDPSGGYNRYIAGTRFWFLPHEYVKLGLTYLASGPLNDSLELGWDNRLQIYGSDLNVNIEDRFLLGAEFAMSSAPGIDKDLRALAYRANFLWEPNERFRMWGGYFRVDKDFLTFGSTSLGINNVVDEIKFEDPFNFKSGTTNYDLDPDIEVGLGTDEESWGIATEYRFAEDHTVTAGYREIRDNIPEESSLPTTNTRDIFMTYKYTPPGGFKFFAGGEWIRSWDDLSPRTVDTERWRILLGTIGYLGETRMTGPVSMEALYIYEDYRNFTDSLENEIANYLLLRFDFEPRPDLNFYIEQQEIFVSNLNYKGLATRSDATYIGVYYKRPKFETEITYKHLREQDYIIGSEVGNEHLISTFVRYRLSENLLAQMKVEFGIRQDRSASPDITYYEYLAEAEVAWDITPYLLLSLLYEMEYDIDSSSSGRNMTLQDEATVIMEFAPEDGKLSLYFEGKHERERVRTAPLSAIETNTDTFIVGGKYLFAPDWELVGGFKKAFTYGDLESSKTEGFVEVGYDVCDYLKLSLGYEHQEFYDHEDPDSDFNADIGYLKLTGKF